MPVLRILGWTNTISLERESGERGPDPNGAPSDGFGCLGKKAESYTGETGDGGTSVPGRKSCPRQRSQPKTFGDGKERNVTRVFCVRLCTSLSLRRSWLLTRPTDGPRTGVGEEAKTVAYECEVDGMPR